MMEPPTMVPVRLNFTEISLAKREELLRSVFSVPECLHHRVGLQTCCSRPLDVLPARRRGH